MTNNRIKEYLEKGGSYEYGCSLFLIITHNKAYAARLMATDNEQNRKLLHVELSTYIKSQPGYWEEFVNETNEAAMHPEPEVVQSIQSVFKESKPIDTDIKNRIRNERNALMRERGHLHGRLHEAETNEQRHELAIQIMEVLQPRIDILNQELRNVDSGQIPERFLKQNLTAEQYKQIENLKKYIRRTKSEITKTTDPNRVILLEAKLTEFEEKLKACV